MKFLILGSGMQGRACAFDLLRNPKTESVLLADISEENLADAKALLRSKKVETVRAAASDLGSIKRLAQGRSAMISAVPYSFNLELAKAAVAAKTHFIDLGGNTDIVRKELALHAAAKKAGVSILPDIGLGPGLTTTLAVHGISQLDETHEVLIRDGGLPQKPRPPLNYLLTFSEEGLINEYVENATALRGGKRVELPGLSEIETIDLPPPLGRCEAAHAAGGLSTLAWTYEGKIDRMDCKLIRYPGHCRIVNALREIGFFGEERISVDGCALSPRELSARLLRRYLERPGEKDFVVIHTVVRGVKDGRRAEIIYDMLDRYDDINKMTAMARTTGFPVAIVAQMLANGEIDKPGAYPVETGIPPEPFLRHMRRRGFDISWKLRLLP